MFVALEGIDGAGKSTAAQALYDRFLADGSPRIELLRKSEPSLPQDDTNPRAADLKRLIWSRRETEPSIDALGPHFHLFLHAAWFSAQHRLRIAPLRDCPDSVAIADGWYYRSVAKGVVQGSIASDWALALFSHIDPPDLVVLIDVAPEIAWSRRPAGFSAWELGRHDGRSGEPRDAFCAYQGAIRDRLRQFAAQMGWSVIAPPPEWGVERVVDAIHERIFQRATGKTVGKGARSDTL